MTLAGSTCVANLYTFHTLMFCTIGDYLSCLSLQVSAHIAHHSEALLKLNLILIYPTFTPMSLRHGEEEEGVPYVQAIIVGSMRKVCETGHTFCSADTAN